MGWDSIGEILKKARSAYPSFSERLSEAEAVKRWGEAVGDAIAKHAHPIAVRRGVLIIEVGHPLWRSELHFRKQQILDKLNAGQKIFEDLKFVQPSEIANPTPFLWGSKSGK